MVVLFRVEMDFVHLTLDEGVPRQSDQPDEIAQYILRFAGNQAMWLISGRAVTSGSRFGTLLTPN